MESTSSQIRKNSSKISGAQLWLGIVAILSGLYGCKLVLLGSYNHPAYSSSSTEVVRLLGAKIITDSLLKGATALTLYEGESHSGGLLFTLCLANCIINFSVQLAGAMTGGLQTEADWILFIGHGFSIIMLTAGKHMKIKLKEATRTRRSMSGSNGNTNGTRRTYGHLIRHIDTTCVNITTVTSNVLRTRLHYKKHRQQLKLWYQRHRGHLISSTIFAIFYKLKKAQQAEMKKWIKCAYLNEENNRPQVEGETNSSSISKEKDITVKVVSNSNSPTKEELNSLPSLIHDASVKIHENADTCTEKHDANPTSLLDAETDAEVNREASKPPPSTESTTPNPTPIKTTQTPTASTDRNERIDTDSSQPTIHDTETKDNATKERSPKIEESSEEEYPESDDSSEDDQTWTRSTNKRRRKGPQVLTRSSLQNILNQYGITDVQEKGENVDDLLAEAVLKMSAEEALAKERQALEGQRMSSPKREEEGTETHAPPRFDPLDVLCVAAVGDEALT
ncbi:hypothetical protein PROFUN_13083 [Planoprotostelium fungivorum]|uniref:Uncharacterized protein n=1 Tax=Planoprotostelium fungivorum TaxID=1890364 RepID=A0A2P6N5H7_9EUKA|nr:hypothetical protein PROFUN_13083 [Planoprotostelium fungivorum]